MSVSGLSFSLYIIGYCFTRVLLEYQAGHLHHRLHYFPLWGILRVSLLWPFYFMVLILHHIATFIYRRNSPG